MPRYCLYTGRPEEALALLQAASQHSSREIDLEAAIDEAVALIIKGEQQITRQQVLNLWRRKEKRSTAIALLNLISLYGGGQPSVRPELGREKAVTETVLAIIEYCLRCPGEQSGIADVRNVRALQRLCRCGMTIWSASRTTVA